MRVVVVGTSGSGKSTFAAGLSARTGLTYIELDLINWGPGWAALSKNDPPAFIARVDAAIAGEAWVVSGGYSEVRDRIWRRASDLVWLDLPRSVVMRQVIGRSFRRAASGEDVFPGCKETFAGWLDREHPIRWAWDTYDRRKREFTARIAKPEYAHLRVHRCCSRADVKAAMENLAGAG